MPNSISDYETGRVPTHHPVVEDQPIIPRNGYTVGEHGALAACYHRIDLPIVPAQDEYEWRVAEAKRLLTELGG